MAHAIGLVEFKMTELLVLAAVIGAGTIFWIANTREYDAANVKLRKQMADKRARFARAEATEDVVLKPKVKIRSFGHR